MNKYESPKMNEFSVTPSVREAMLHAAKGLVGIAVEVLPADEHNTNSDNRVVQYTASESENTAAVSMNYADRLAESILGIRPKELGLDPQYGRRDPRDILGVAAANAGYWLASQMTQVKFKR